MYASPESEHKWKKCQNTLITPLCDLRSERSDSASHSSDDTMWPGTSVLGVYIPILLEESM